MFRFQDKQMRMCRSPGFQHHVKLLMSRRGSSNIALRQRWTMPSRSLARATTTTTTTFDGSRDRYLSSKPQAGGFGQRFQNISTSTSRSSTAATTATAAASAASHMDCAPRWLQGLHSETAMEQKHLFTYLGLETFTDEELDNVYEAICQTPLLHTACDQQCDDADANANAVDDADSTPIFQQHLAAYLNQRIQQLEDENDLHSEVDEQGTSYLRRKFAKAESQRAVNFFLAQDSVDTADITKEQFTTAIRTVASSLDFKRVWPLVASMLLVGSSVGVVTPAMPFVVKNLGLTAGEYGFVVSAFALAKMSGNIPSAVLVERHGRKPYLVYSMSIIAMGVGGIGLANSFEQLYLCRLLSGLGVAGLSTAATMAVTDISTPLNRASTFAPIMSAFAAGMALGPAIGGFSVDYIGINTTFYMVGASYIGLAFVNNALLDETKAKPMDFPWQVQSTDAAKEVTIRESFQQALGQWMPLLSEAPIRNVCIMNGFYWVALAGSQMTLLPLILTDPSGLGMTATNVGQVYMGMSIVQVLGNPVMAKAVDMVGKAPGIIGGCTLISTAMATLPFCADTYQMAGVLAVWAAGSSLLSTAPLAFISDRVDDAKRAQAIALLRTSGDVGFLLGASTMGALADFAGSLDMAMQSSSGILLTATGWFAVRQMLSSRLEEHEQKS